MSIKLVLGTGDPRVLRRWREAVKGISAVTVAAPLQELTKILETTKPTVCLIDKLIPGGISISQFQELVTSHKHTHFLLLTDVPEDEEGWDILRAGGKGYCNRYMSPELMFKVVKLVARGEVWVGRRLMAHLIAQFGASEPDPVPMDESLSNLTPREWEIATLVSEGASNKRIAQRLDITERTVKSHLSSIFRKTDTRDRLQLALLFHNNNQTADSTNVQ